MTGVAVRVWLAWLQVVVPAFLLHELAHWAAAKLWAGDARLVRTPAGRVRCATAWNRGELWRRIAVAFAPAAAGACWGGLVAAAGVVVAPTGALYLAGVLWGSLNLIILTVPSPADIRLALGGPSELNNRSSEGAA